MTKSLKINIKKLKMITQNYYLAAIYKIANKLKFDH